MQPRKPRPKHENLQKTHTYSKTRQLDLLIKQRKFEKKKERRHKQKKKLNPIKAPEDLELLLGHPRHAWGRYRR